MFDLIEHFDAFQDNSVSTELGLATSEDAMLDNLSDRAEKEIISGASSGKNLIGHCASFLSKLCRNFSMMQKVIVSLFFSWFTIQMFTVWYY